MLGSMKKSLKMSSTTYIPGTCNIGRSEIRQRKLVGFFGLFFSLSSLVGLMAVNAPREARLGIFLPLMVASIGYFQVRSKFCLAYGLAGTFNLGKLGDISRVSDPLNIRADRLASLRLFMKSFLLAALATMVVFVLPF